MGLSGTAQRAVRNAWALFVGDGIEPPHDTASAVVADGPHRTLRRYGESDAGAPVLLVPPLAAPARCYDLRPGQSLVQHLVATGRNVHVLDFGTMDRSDRHLGFEHWVDDIVPEAIARVAELCGGRDVDLAAWSLGGTLCLLTAAAHPGLPIRSITAFGTPIDYERIPFLGPARHLGRLVGEPALTAVTHLLGGVPAPLVQLGYRATALERELTRPWFVARNLADAGTLARMEAIDRFQADMPGYPGRLFHQMAMRLTVANELATGRVRFEDRTIDLADVTVPVLALAGSDDVLAPVPAVEAIGRVLPGSPHVRFEVVPGSHLGLLAGLAARGTSWAHFTEFLDDPAAPVPPGATGSGGDVVRVPEFP